MLKKGRKPLNSLKSELHNLKFFVSKVFKMSPSYVFAAIIESMLGACIPFISIIGSKYIIDELMGAGQLTVLTKYVAVIVTISLILMITMKSLNKYIKVTIWDILMLFEADMGRHNMGVAYANLEDSKYIELKEKAMAPIRERFMIYTMIISLPNVVKYMLMAAGAFGIICKFDALSIIIIAIPIIITTWLNIRFQKEDLKIQKDMVMIQKDFSYYAHLMYDFSSGKDVRLFKLHEILMERNNACDQKIFDFKWRIGKHQNRFEGQSQILAGLRNAAIYGYIGVKTIINAISIGNFTMYIGAAATFSGAVTNLFNSIVTLRQDCRYLEDYVKLNQIPMENNAGADMPIMEEMSLEFKNVYFKYPGTDKYVLEDVNFQMQGDESCSIVGENGAGKTTMIKLLTRLYKPTKGQILINGVDINTLSFEKYSKLLSVVFQDFKLFDFSIADNIAAGDTVDEMKLESVLSSAGILDKVESLINGVNNYVGKQFDEDGTEFSGGEMQKLAIARAEYKKSSIIVLDEPTAALDPLAEAEIYERFNELIDNKTAIYISHRLSSCRFCNKIIFIGDGKILEHGNHDTLIGLNGRYADMFKMQASKYI